MHHRLACYILVALLVNVEAARVKAKEEADLAEESYVADVHMSMEDTEELSVTARSFCSSARCDGASDGSKHDIGLKFRYPDDAAGPEMHDEVVTFRTMPRDDVAVQKEYQNYHHGSLHDCAPVTGHFEYSHDWPSHMQNNMREGLWPNQPEKIYSCVEHCKLKTFDADGNQLNQGQEPVVWVQRDSHRHDALAKIQKVGWKPASCTVGTAVQEHWWKQRSEVPRDQLMVDQSGLPVWPFVSYVHQPVNWIAPIHAEYAKKFCSLTESERISVVERVTLNRPNRWAYGNVQWYGQSKLRLAARNYFPDHFPRKCDNNDWTAANADGVVHYEGELE
jgi:hypothetical protein